MWKTLKLVAKLWEYKNSKWESKAQWLECWVLVESDKWTSIKINALPIDKERDWWLKAFPFENKWGENQNQSNKWPEDDLPF